MSELKKIIDFILPRKSAEKRKGQMARFKKSLVKRKYEVGTQKRANARFKKSGKESFSDRMKGGE